MGHLRPRTKAAKKRRIKRKQERRRKDRGTLGSPGKVRT
jgi:hypothetical protein